MGNGAPSVPHEGQIRDFGFLVKFYEVTVLHEYPIQINTNVHNVNRLIHDVKLKQINQNTDIVVERICQTSLNELVVICTNNIGIYWKTSVM